jgi:endo-alpha-N-acetylgalactosaminidase
MPPPPDVAISDLVPLRAVGPGHSASSAEHRFSPGVNPPVRDLSNRKTPLKVRGKIYAKGMGVQATDLLVYELKPEYDRFVALAGDDEQILSINNGSNLAKYPSVVFKIFIDGKLMSESPMMRMSEGPWRFDVKIPEHSQRISLVADDGGNGNKEDLADWVEAGFVKQK